MIAGPDGWGSDDFYDNTNALARDYTNSGKLDIRLFYSYMNEAKEMGLVLTRWSSFEFLGTWSMISSSGFS